MKNYIKKNISNIISIFILLSPILDLLTGICIHTLKINLTIGIIVRVLFLVFIALVVISIFKKKNILIPYLIIGLYFILYILGVIIYKDGVGLFNEIQGLVKVFYFPIVFIALYNIKDEIRISKLTLFTTVFLYLILIFIPTLFNIGYKSYEITKAGTLGFFNSANEVSGIISILTPIIFIIIFNSKKIIPKILLGIMYLTVILMMGTKTPLLSLMITIGFCLIYHWIKLFKKKKYKNIGISLLILLIGVGGLLLVLPKTNFYKNIKTHLNYLEVDNIYEVFKDPELVDHFIFSQRLTFLSNKSRMYDNSALYQQTFGIGYINSGKNAKLIEMDYFDILYDHGVVGFILLFSICVYIIIELLKIREKFSFEDYMLRVSLLLVLFLIFFTGHIITAPAVSIIIIILLLSIAKRKKKDLLFTDVNLKIGGIETAQINLLNRIDYKKYNVTLILEERCGELLNRVPKEVNIKEVKVSNNKIVVLRKLINATRKLIFKILNYNNYDFSCCYTTYSYSSNKLALMASSNSSFYVHSDYSNVYNNEKDFREFFDTRNINEFKSIIFVSNESRNSFLKYYNNLEKKTYVFNNFIDTKNILDKSNEPIEEKKSKNKKLFVFVGRLDDSSKKLKRAINLAHNINDIELWIIGDGPDRKMYEEYNSNNDRVKFLGRKTNPYPYMKEADYVILTSDYEGFPVTYLESIVLNKDIITTLNTSDDNIDMKDYAYIISKDEDKMIKEVKDIIKKKSKKKTINLEELQEDRISRLEKIFNK